MKNDFFHRLLALHYVYPKPLDKLNSLLKEDLQLERLHNQTVLQLSKKLSISPASASRLKTAYTESLNIPFSNVYEKYKITPIPYLHPLYPESLLELVDPPAVLYAKGQLSLLQNQNRIAVIGSRKASSYSRNAMGLIIPPLVDDNFIIVSGLAKGADAMAHETAINLGGSTIAVTGSGFLHPYPKENVKLHHIIEENHLIITEYPPYMKPKKWNFPMRNRIISGLCRGIVVTEAQTKSGTWSTVDHAMEHGKDIFAVPGNIFSPLSEGPHKLIAEGEKPVWNGWQVLEEYREKVSGK
ncbi:DNA-processing protein DprA [Planomicrobium sp. CPCC 101110]|uniref:DNA-processing protein DprA n=1 Tax=Planomicrobium sp. CPCC 101110 TaxID=2599619 RepID=UPI0011B6ED7A|nr:DNA-processing protein DprA [Planomicrobium sp. CPCC 101110]TWT28175.1 DNA-protecting protein DprA [Planomicrobium sp. CPCC 101110]